MEKTNIRRTILLVLGISFVATSLTALFLNVYYSHSQYRMLGAFCEAVIGAQPETKETILKILKEGDFVSTITRHNLLQAFGYQPSNLNQSSLRVLLFAGIGFVVGALIFLFTFWYLQQKTNRQIKMLTDYLEKINSGISSIPLEASESEFSKLQDEIYKTVTSLYQTRDAALTAKSNFADNLSNIAHQLKTPITAISLTTQLLREKEIATDYFDQIRRQINRLTHLEEALLLLSRIDAGTLILKPVTVDVFTLLTLAADNLQELYVQAGIGMDIPEQGETQVSVDLEWTMEAVMNLMKNCMEHSPEEGRVHCTYEGNPLYVQIKIWDEGRGFAKEEQPYLFDRFYRGKDAKEGSIGIGLALAKEIIEMQNGILNATKAVTGGACFEIRFYAIVKNPS